MFANVSTYIPRDSFPILISSQFTTIVSYNTKRTLVNAQHLFNALTTLDAINNNVGATYDDSNSNSDLLIASIDSIEKDNKDDLGSNISSSLGDN